MKSIGSGVLLGLSLGAALVACYLSDDDYSSGRPAIVAVDPDASPDGAGGAGGKAGSGGSAGAPSVCQTLAEAHCARYAVDCLASSAALSPEGLASCAERAAQICEAILDLQGVSATKDAVIACASAIPKSQVDLGCAEGFNPFRLCSLAGSRKAGQPCASDAQCEGAFCTSTLGSGCGVCAARIKQGDPCEKGPVLCERGLSCQEGACKPRKGVGASCAADDDCLPEAVCAGSTCQAKPGKAGDDCADRPCDETRGVTCDGAKCAAIGKLGVGAACEITEGALPAARCPFGAYCRPSMGNASQGTCTLSTKEGALCNDDRECQPPARCTSSKCLLLPSCSP